MEQAGSDGEAAPARGARPWWRRVDPGAARIADVADEVIDALADDDRAVLASVWQERGSSELQVGGSFAAIAGLLIEHGTADTVLKLVSRAVRDEVRHAEIAVDMAARVRGDEPRWPAPRSFPVPRFAPAGERLRATLLVVAMCCINETLACGVLEGQLAQAKSPLAREALRAVLSDEVDHARAGWAHLVTPFVTRAMKDEIGADWLPRLMNARLKDLADEIAPFPGEQLPEHGILTRKQRKEIVATVLGDVVLPGFERVGIDATNARRWAADTFGVGAAT